MQKKFTLVELLVVIAIIGILASLLLPSLENAREKSRQAVCVSNQKQFGYGMIMQSDANDGVIVRGARGDGVDSFTFYSLRNEFGLSENYDVSVANLISYFSKLDVFRCPSFISPDTKLTYIVNSTRFNLDYSLNTPRELGVSNNARENIAFTEIPESTCYTTEINKEILSDNTFNGYNIWTYNDLPLGYNGEVQSGGRMANSVEYIHPKVTTTLFMDGHAGIVSFKSSTVINSVFLTSQDY